MKTTERKEQKSEPQLTVARAKVLVEMIINANPDNFVMRSCWNCNGAHEHLKELEIPLKCFVCGHAYFRGVDITEESL